MMSFPSKIQQTFYLFVFLSQITGIAAVILIFVYYSYFGGGYSWQSDPGKEFNLHPPLMTLGLIFLYGDAVLVYRIFRDTKKIIVKIIHAILLALALICGSIGLKAVFDSHNLSKPPDVNLYSLHSWIGLIAVILFGLQWVTGFIFFLFPKLSESFRRRYMPSHKYWGKAIFLLAVIAAIAGITEDAEFSQLYKPNGRASQRVAINIFGILVIVFAFIVLYLLNNGDYEREPEPNPEELPLVVSRSSSPNDDYVK